MPKAAVTPVFSETPNQIKKRVTALEDNIAGLEGALEALRGFRSTVQDTDRKALISLRASAP